MGNRKPSGFWGKSSVDEESNEITAIPELLGLIEIEDCIVTIDAMGCQKKIAEQIIDQGADYVLALKGNHGTLHEEVEHYFGWAQAAKFKEVAHSYHQTIDGDHGRIETRRYWITEDVEWLASKPEWSGLHSIGMVEAERVIGEQTTVEAWYYISSLEADAKQFGARCGDIGGWRTRCTGC